MRRIEWRTVPPEPKSPDDIESWTSCSVGCNNWIGHIRREPDGSFYIYIRDCNHRWMIERERFDVWTGERSTRIRSIWAAKRIANEMLRRVCDAWPLGANAKREDYGGKQRSTKTKGGSSK